jgi:hypothetical protein
MSQYHELVVRLEGISSTIDDLALQELREAVAAKAQRSATDRDLMRARRAVEKAAAILRQLSQETESPDLT